MCIRMYDVIKKKVSMYEFVFVGWFCMWICQAHYMFEESHLWPLCDWKKQDGDLCVTPRFFLDFSLCVYHAC